MKSKTYLYLGILVILLVAAYFLTTDRGEKTSSYEFSETKLFEIDSAKVDRVEIKNPEGTLVFSKATGEWRIDQPYQYRTVSSYVENIISNLKNLKLESIVSTNPAKKDSYGFKDGEQTEVTVYENGSAKGKFLLGATSSGTSSYVKKFDSDNIYIADNVDRTNFVKDNLNEWRDKNIVSIPKQSINSIDFIYPSESFTVKRDSTLNYKIGTDSVGKTIDGVLNLLERFDAMEFPDTTLSDQTVFTERIIVDHGPKTEIKFLKQPAPSTKYLVMVTGDNQIYGMEESYAKNLLKTRSELLGK